MALSPTIGEPVRGALINIDYKTRNFPNPTIYEEKREVTPSTEMMREQIIGITASSAVAAYLVIQEAYSGSEFDTAQLKKDIDHAATDNFETGLNNADYLTNVYCEGDKEGAKDPSAAVRTIRGLHGPQILRGDLSEVIVGGIIDPVEGTKPASRNEVGSTSVFVGSRGGVVREIPGEDKARYFNRIAGPASMKGKISIQNSPQENIAAVAQAFGIPVHEVEVVVLDRPRQRDLIDCLQSMGVNLTLIKDGDFMPGYLAVKSDSAFLSYGSGGKEEGFALGMLAKKYGAAFDGQLVGEKGEFLLDYPETLTAEDIVSGEPSDIFVSISSITGESFFGLNPIREEIGSHGETVYLVDTISEDGHGFRREEVRVSTRHPEWPDNNILNNGFYPIKTAAEELQRDLEAAP